MSTSNVKRIIFDCDLGTDDAVALYLLLLAEREGKVKIEMIVCSRGNASLYHVSRNVVRMLEYANRTDIPIYKGSHEVLLPRTEEDEFYHGVDGFGDLVYDTEPDTSIIRPEPAFVAMRDLIINNPNEITLMVVGPMTNCAILLRMYEDVADKIKDIHIMGGNHNGVGNVSPAAEFNFHMDPEAAHITFGSAKCPMHLLTWECCFNTKTPMAWRMKTLGTSAGGKTWQLIHRGEAAIYKNPRENWFPCDAYLVAALLYPEIILDQTMAHVDVELAGKLTRGQVAIDHLKSKMSASTDVKRIIFDCDLGTDDAVALYLLLLAEREGKVKIEMIICSRGNARQYHVCRNVVRMLEYANRTDIPIYRGSYDVLLPSTFEDQNYHGVDGFADLTYDEEPDTSIIRSESAFVAMRDLIVNNPHEITMIVVGPMTNCAILLRMYEDVAENIKDIRIMGGNHHGVGNVVQAAEFNFHMDPEAAHIVLASAKCPMHLLTWECCNINAKTPMSWRLKELGTAAAGRTWQLIHRAESKIYSKPKEHWHPCDAYLVATLLYPEIIVDQSMEHVNVELAGRLTRGQVAIDHMHKRKPNVNLIKEINYKMFEKIIMAAHTQL